jgi:hypothetical protein
MRKRVLLISATATLLLFSGCSTKVMMPYDEEFTCPRANEGGECGSVTKIYNNSLKIKNDAPIQVLSSKEKKALEEAKNPTEEQTALIAALWRMNKEAITKIADMEARQAVSDKSSKMAVGLVSSLSDKLNKIDEKVSKINTPLENAQNDTNTTTTSAYVKVPVQYNNSSSIHQCGAMPILSNIHPVEKIERVAQKKKTRTKIGDLETHEPCDANSTCYTTRNVYLTKDSNKTSNNLRVLEKSTKVSTGQIIDGRVEITDSKGWITAKYLKKFKDDKDSNKTKVGEKNATVKK